MKEIKQNSRESRQDSRKISRDSRNSHPKTRRDFLSDSAKIAGIAAFATALPLNAKPYTQKYDPQATTINLTADARQNYHKLFGTNPNSGLEKTDPEFIENHANFAFGEVFESSKNIDLPTRLKLILGALIAAQGRAEFRTMLDSALKNGVNPSEIKEIIYHTTPYIGIGKSMDFVILANEVFFEKGIKLPLTPQGTTTRENRGQKGLEVQRKFFGEAIDKGNVAAPSDLKHIRRFLSANCFGDYYTRGGLDLAFRELLTFVILASLGGADAQVKAHVQGNLNIGHSRAYLIEVITALVPYIGYPRALNALTAIDSLTLGK